MLSSLQVEQFHRDGFLKGGIVLTESEIETLQRETLRVIEERENSGIPQPVLCHQMGGGNVWQIVNISEASGPFHRLVHNPTIVEEMRQLVGDHAIRLWHDQIQYKPPTTGGANHWHQDGPYWPILQPKSQVTAWVALDDATEENGCMRMVPGSHLWGDKVKFLEDLPNFDAMPESFEGHDLKVVSCPVEKGAVHFHHSLTWHGSGKNESGRPRRAIALHYMTDETCFDASGDHVMKKYVEVPNGAVLSGRHFPLV